MTQTKSEGRDAVRFEFWTRLLRAMDDTQSAFCQITDPSGYPWLKVDSSISNVAFMFVVKSDGTKSGDWYVRLYLNRDDKEENKLIFDQLLLQKNTIEDDFGSPLKWARHDRQHYCEIWAEEEPGNVLDPDQWPDVIDRMTENMCRLEKAMKEPLEQVNKKLKSGATKQADDT